MDYQLLYLKFQACRTAAMEKIKEKKTTARSLENLE